ncbi:GGDEF domain-containing protein [Alkalimonas delamerensis]|uniref:diguanylate cyclase n=1 Tax=Alkalimonas delamerensis TaxID=265981 RepID=A0ABT9GTF2_9GAMM|nr:GGDEF domain-containing protein [Alkalimonas delamerensis]MDP4530254.1 GGDEF domain-containing protein [Alkalimonas delamerensis]
MRSWHNIKLSRRAIALLLGYVALATLVSGWIWHTKLSLQQHPPMRVIDVSRQIEMLNREVSLYIGALSDQAGKEAARPLWTRVQARQQTIQGLLRNFVDLGSNFKVLELQLEQLRQMLELPADHIDPLALQDFIELIQEDMDIFASDVHRTMQWIVADQTRLLYRYSAAVAWLSLAMFAIGLVLLTLFVVLIQQNQLLNRLATEDGLTHLLNRRSAMLQGKLLTSMAQRTRQPLALAVLDIDHFKAINDQYGHPAGDAALKMVAQVMRTCIRRETDVLARIGGEEFMLIMPETSAEVAEQLCKVMLSALAEARVSDSFHIHITASMGLAISEQGQQNFEHLYRAADAALYQAKAAGRNRLKRHIAD